MSIEYSSKLIHATKYVFDFMAALLKAAIVIK